MMKEFHERASQCFRVGELGVQSNFREKQSEFLSTAASKQKKKNVKTI